jgi:hypothetical protein
MSYFYPDEINITNETLELQYPSNEINKRHIEKKMNTVANSKKNTFKPIEVEGDYIASPNTFYQLTLPNKEPNLYYSKLKPTGFSARYLSLYGLIHDNIADVTDNDSSIVGELVIEHRPKTAVNLRMFTCYLLQQKDGEPNDLDNFVAFFRNEDKKPKELTFDLNNLIGKQKNCIHYTSEYDHVFLFTKPIPINTTTADFIKNNLTSETTLFEKSAISGVNMIEFGTTEQKKKEKTANTEDESPIESFIGSLFGNSTKEGNQNMDDIYIDCQPVDESDETETAVISSIMNTSDSKKKQSIDFYKMVNNFFMFILIIVVCRMAIPTIYKVAILNNIIRWRQDSDEYKKYIRLADYLILFLVGVYILHYFRIGMTKEGKGIFTVFFMLIAAVSVFGYSIIQLKKRDPDYMTIMKDGFPEKIEYEENEKINVGFVEFIKFPFIAYGNALKASFFALWLTMFIIYSIFLKLLKISDKKFWVKEFLLFNTTVLSPFIYLCIKGSA